MIASKALDGLLLHVTLQNLRRAARAAAERLQATVATDIARLRDDAGITVAELARASGVDASYIRRVELGTAAPSLETCAQLAAALGADLSVRLYPNTGPAIRDRHQARILEALLAILHPRWHPYPEIAVRRPSRGWIDVGLHNPHGRVLVASEIQSELRRLEQLIRWHAEKAASVESWDGWPRLGEPPDISQLLIVRETRSNLAVAREFRRTLDAAYPAHPDDTLAALTRGDRWPGAALLWATGGDRQDRPVRIVARR